MKNTHISLFRNLSDRLPMDNILSEFLQLGNKYLNIIEQIRNCSDKATRARIKRTKLPAAAISATLSTRESSKPLEERLTNYTPSSSSTSTTSPTRKPPKNS